MITSLKNDRVKHIRALQGRRRVRQRERQMVLEGVRLIEEAVAARLPPSLVFYTQSVENDGRAAALLEALRAMDAPVECVSEAVMAACSDTQTPQGLLAVLPLPDLPRPQNPSLILILDRVRDPGNLGTLLRTALAAGVEQVILAPGTVDASNPKAVRAGMGAHFRLPVTALRWEAIGEAVDGCGVYLATADSETPYTGVDWPQRVALIVGGEAGGAGERAAVLAQKKVAIPMLAGVESLNTGVAAAVILFEIARCRAAPPPGSTAVA
jgi:TrmH family RNA methyltransferase